jgi:ferredoxin
MYHVGCQPHTPPHPHIAHAPTHTSTLTLLSPASPQERQQLQRCLLHTLNNLLQRPAWTVASLNDLCDSIHASRCAWTSVQCGRCVRVCMVV